MTDRTALAAFVAATYAEALALIGTPAPTYLDMTDLCRRVGFSATATSAGDYRVTPTVQLVMALNHNMTRAEALLARERLDYFAADYNDAVATARSTRIELQSQLTAFAYLEA